MSARISATQIVQFLLEKSDKPEAVDIHIRSADDMKILVTKASAIETHLTGLIPDSTKSRLRSLSVTIDSYHKEAALAAPQIVSDEKLECAHIDIRDWLTVPPQSARNVGYIAGISWHIAPRSPRLSGSPPHAGTVTTLAKGGTITLREVNVDGLEDADGSKSPFVIFNGHAVHFDIDGSAVKPRPFDYYVAIGAFEVGFTRGNLRIKGVANAIWREQSRLNPTKWERSSPSAVLSGLGLLAGLLYFILPSVGGRLRTNRSFSWLSRRGNR